MDTVELPDVEVLDASGSDIVCLLGARRITVPSLLMQPGTAVRQRGDRGKLVIPRWLGIGLGLVWPFSEATGEVRKGPRTEPPERTDEMVERGGALVVDSTEPRRRPPRRAGYQGANRPLSAGSTVR